jgi:hypothetical protein
VKEEDFTIFLQDFCDFLTGLEASIVEMKKQIAKLVGVAEAAVAHAPQPQPQQPQKMVQLTIQEQLERLKQPFGELADYLTFTIREGKAVLTPRQFLGAENFAKIAKIVREHGGEYISAGKESRFEMPLQK